MFLQEIFDVVIKPKPVQLAGLINYHFSLELKLIGSIPVYKATHISTNNPHVQLAQ